MPTQAIQYAVINRGMNSRLMPQPGLLQMDMLKLRKRNRAIKNNENDHQCPAGNLPDFSDFGKISSPACR